MSTYVNLYYPNNELQQCFTTIQTAIPFNKPTAPGPYGPGARHKHRKCKYSLRAKLNPAKVREM